MASLLGGLLFNSCCWACLGWLPSGSALCLLCLGLQGGEQEQEPEEPVYCPLVSPAGTAWAQKHSGSFLCCEVAKPCLPHHAAQLRCFWQCTWAVAGGSTCLGRTPAPSAARSHTQSVHVPCPLPAQCKLPDYGRDLVQCDTCEQWMHPECAGVSMEVGWLPSSGPRRGLGWATP